VYATAPVPVAPRLADMLTLAASMGSPSLILVAADNLIADLEALLIEDGLLLSRPE
jgi:hypothetical protein